MEGKKGDGFGRVHVKAIEDTLLSELEAADWSKRLGEPVSSPQATRPSKTCKHFLGFLRSLPEGMGIPDECAVCPNIVQCYIKKE
ncbi:MAG: hypothetical protein ACE5KD_01640 [Candidatus Bathyarchaeia archaeon]